MVFKSKKRVFFLEMACEFDPLIEEWEKEKARKYEELAAGVATQYLGYKVRVLPLVIGNLGPVGSLGKSLSKFQVFNPRQLSTVLLGMQLGFSIQAPGF